MKAQSEGLTSEQLSNIRGQLEEIRIAVDGRASELNKSAGAVFRQAAQDPKAAVALYAKCEKMVTFDREGRDESEYREWEDKQKEQFRDPRFLEGLRVQLSYLALSCDAAEAGELKDVFPSLLNYVDSLSNLTELPSPMLLQGVDGSIFAKAYKLEELLSRNQEWEMVPLDIAGIYEKTILPFLREGDADQLIGAWDRRIAQQTQMAQFFSAKEEDGNNRDERRAAENRNRQLQQGKTGNLIRSYNEVDFVEKTLPQLKWDRLRDMALYVDAVQGVAGLLAFARENVEHPKASEWLDDLEQVVEEIASNKSNASPQPPPVQSASSSPPPPSTTGGDATAGVPASNGGSKVTGAVPPGLEPAGN